MLGESRLLCFDAVARPGSAIHLCRFHPAGQPGPISNAIAAHHQLSFPSVIPWHSKDTICLPRARDVLKEVSAQVAAAFREQA
eukprot:1418277-Amphidinium_carterae.2